MYHGVNDFVAPRFPIVTTGTFDGVHTGHLEILNRLTQLARERNGESVVVSYDPHPRTVIQPELKTQLLHTIDDKIDRLEKAGIDHFIIIPFTLEFSRMPSQDFIRNILVRQIGAKILVIGYDHQFGRNREGSIEDLEQFSNELDFEIEQIPVQTYNNVNISSTKIRAALNEGKIEVANQYLGYDFALSGKVVHGRKIGKELGFPTANVVVEDAHKIIPCQGVYAVEVDVDKSSYGGMLNIGWNPTVSENQQRKIEVHIFDFDGDLYDHKIRIRFKKRIRDEQKFDSLLELKNQLKADRAKAWEILH